MTKEELIKDLEKEFEKSKNIVNDFEEKNDMISASFYQGLCAQILSDLEKIKQLKEA